MKAVKGNKEYTIDESQQKGYQDSGFDILDDDGIVIAYGRGKTVPFSDYMKAVEEIGRLHKRIAELEAENEIPKEEIPKKEIPKEPEKKAGTKKAGE